MSADKPADKNPVDPRPVGTGQVESRPPANDENDVNDDSAAVPVLGASAVRPLADLPYTFAKRHGVLLEQIDGELRLVHKPNPSTMALTEARRKAGQAMTMEPVTSDEFDARLTHG